MVVLKATYQGVMLVIISSKKHTTLCCRHSRSLLRKSLSRLYTVYTQCNRLRNYLKLTSTYCSNKKVLGQKPKVEKTVKSKLTFPAVFMTDLISLLQAFRDFIWMYALTLYCQRKSAGMWELWWIHTPKQSYFLTKDIKPNLFTP